MYMYIRAIRRVLFFLGKYTIVSEFTKVAEFWRLGDTFRGRYRFSLLGMCDYVYKKKKKKEVSVHAPGLPFCIAAQYFDKLSEYLS